MQPNEFQSVSSPELFNNFHECKTQQQMQVLRIARLRQLLRPLRFLWRLIK